MTQLRLWCDGIRKSKRDVCLSNHVWILVVQALIDLDVAEGWARVEVAGRGVAFGRPDRDNIILSFIVYRIRRRHDRVPDRTSDDDVKPLSGRFRRAARRTRRRPVSIRIIRSGTNANWTRRSFFLYRTRSENIAGNKKKVDGYESARYDGFHRYNAVNPTYSLHGLFRFQNSKNKTKTALLEITMLKT